MRELLVQAGRHFGLSRDAIEATRRHQVAHAMHELLLAFDEHADATDLMEAIVDIDLSDDRAAVGQSFRNACENLRVLEHIQWPLFDHLVERGDERSRAEQLLLDEAHSLLSQPEHASKLAELEKIQARLIDLMTAKPPKPKTDETGDEKTFASNSMRVRGAEAAGAVQTWLSEQLEGRDDTEFEITISIEEAE